MGTGGQLHEAVTQVETNAAEVNGGGVCEWPGRTRLFLPGSFASGRGVAAASSSSNGTYCRARRAEKQDIGPRGDTEYTVEVDGMTCQALYLPIVQPFANGAGRAWAGRTDW